MSVISKPKINGGNYKAIDTQDGWYTLKDIPTLAPVKKGQKNAPFDVAEEWFNDAIKFGQDAYKNGKIAYPVHVTHTDDAGIHNPEFGGYYVPSSIKKMDLPDVGEVPVLFSDYKIKKSVFEKMQAGELGYLSPEIRNWNKRRVSSVALLDSIPPHNPFPLMTIGEVVVDGAAKFEAELPTECAIARFSDGFERVTFDPRETAKDKDTETKVEGEKMADVKPIQDEQPGKPNAAPVEQVKPGKPAEELMATKMSAENDPKMAAKFAAMEDANSKLMARLDAIEAEKKAAALEGWGLEQMAGYQIGSAAKKSIAKFAQSGEASLKEHVAMLQEVTPKDSPRTFAAAEAANAVPINDPALAKFAQAGPEKLEAAARFASEYRTLKAHPAGRGMNIREEEYVKFQMDQQENGGERHWDISVGFGK